MTLVQETNFSVTLTVDGDDYGVWDSLEGGDVATESTTYRAGGMAAAEPLVGTPVTNEITITRGYRPDRDMDAEQRLLSRVGRWCIVGRQVLDEYGIAPTSGGLLVYDGIISRIDTPKHDSMGNAVTRLSVTVTVRGLPRATFKP